MARKYVRRNGQMIPKYLADLANQIARLRADGYTNEKIAKELNLSEAQVVNISNREWSNV